MTHGLYLSAYQGKLTTEARDKLIAQDVDFVGLRTTSGAGYVDPTWEHNAAMLRDSGILLFPWHFTTTDDATKQYLNFSKQFAKFDKWRLPPAQDCEGYTSVAGQIFSLSELQSQPAARLVYQWHVLGTGGIRIAISPEGYKAGVWQEYTLSYPTEATIDAIGRWLTVWMAAQPALAKYVYPVIYTNVASGNRIFKTASMKRYPLWVANWNTPGKPPLTQPAIPTVWAGKPWYIWQDGIVDGKPYGIDGQVDHDIWGSLFPFPGDEPPPPPPVEDTAMTLKLDGQNYAGKLQEK